MNNCRPATKIPMTEDFSKTLETLTAADLSFLNHKSTPVTDPQPSADPSDSESTHTPNTEPLSTGKPKTPRSRKASVKARDAKDAGVEPASENVSDTPQVATPPVAGANDQEEPASKVDAKDVSTEPATGKVETGVPAADPSADVSNPDTPQRKRTTVPRDWPAVGTKLKAEYFGQTYHAEVVPAKKRLKSGKQIRLLDGPAAGRRLDSFSKAMLVATARQRREMKLKHKGVSNGWSFWFELSAT